MEWEAFGGHIVRWRIGVRVWKGRGLQVGRCNVALGLCNEGKGLGELGNGIWIIYREKMYHDRF